MDIVCDFNVVACVQLSYTKLKLFFKYAVWEKERGYKSSLMIITIENYILNVHPYLRKDTIL